MLVKDADDCDYRTDSCNHNDNEDEFEFEESILTFDEPKGESLYKQ